MMIKTVHLAALFLASALILPVHVSADCTSDFEIEINDGWWAATIADEEVHDSDRKGVRGACTQEEVKTCCT